VLVGTIPGGYFMAKKETVSISTDPVFLKELSEYLDVLSNPIRLKILKIIEKEPKEISEIASRLDTSYANTKKHWTSLWLSGLLKKRPDSEGRRQRGFTRSGNFPLLKGVLR
jgi:DNA-binding MarR family transcriptional regulator